MRLQVKDKMVEKNPSLPFTSISIDSLPSKGLSYKLLEASPTIRYRPYTFGEVKRITQEAETNTLQDNVMFALEGVQTSFKEEMLTFQDFLFISLLRRLSTIGSSDVTLASSCLSCSSDVSKVISSKDIEFKDIEAPALPLKITINGRKLEFLPLTVLSYLELVEKKAHSDEIALMTKCAVGDDKGLYEFIYNMDSKGVGALQQVDNYLDHKIVDVEIECSCGFRNSIELDGGRALLLPFRKSDEPDDYDISFGNEDEDKPSGH